MCGLAGAIIGGTEHKQLGKKRAAEIRVILTDLLLCNQARGKHATGVAVCRHSGGRAIAKAAVDADRFTASAEYARVMRLRGKPCAVLGHTRWATQGRPEDNANNHPIEAGKVVGTHNGHIQNADRLFQARGLTRAGRVDSEVVFRMADAAPSLLAFRRGFRAAMGNAALAWVDRRQPSVVRLVRRDKPLVLVAAPELNALFYSSEEWPLSEALDGYDWARLDLPNNTLGVVDTRADLSVYTMPL